MKKSSEREHLCLATLRKGLYLQTYGGVLVRVHILINSKDVNKFLASHS